MCGANKLTGKLEVVLKRDEWISLFGRRTFKQRYVFMLSTRFVRASGNGVCSAPTRETQVEWKINHGNQGFENLFALCPIWSNIHIYICILIICVCVCVRVLVCVCALIGCLLPPRLYSEHSESRTSQLALHLPTPWLPSTPFHF